MKSISIQERFTGFTSRLRAKLAMDNLTPIEKEQQSESFKLLLEAHILRFGLAQILTTESGELASYQSVVLSILNKICVLEAEAERLCEASIKRIIEKDIAMHQAFGEYPFVNTEVKQ